MCSKKHALLLCLLCRNLTNPSWKAQRGIQSSISLARQALHIPQQDAWTRREAGSCPCRRAERARAVHRGNGDRKSLPWRCLLKAQTTAVGRMQGVGAEGEQSSTTPVDVITWSPLLLGRGLGSYLTLHHLLLKAGVAGGEKNIIWANISLPFSLPRSLSGSLLMFHTGTSFLLLFLSSGSNNLLWLDSISLEPLKTPFLFDVGKGPPPSLHSFCREELAHSPA